MLYVITNNKYIDMLEGILIYETEEAETLLLIEIDLIKLNGL